MCPELDSVNLDHYFDLIGFADYFGLFVIAANFVHFAVIADSLSHSEFAVPKYLNDFESVDWSYRAH